MCGKLFCHNGQGSPNYGRMVRFGECKASFYDDHTKDYGQVDVGTKCGDGMVGTHRVCVWAGGYRAGSNLGPLLFTRCAARTSA